MVSDWLAEESSTVATVKDEIAVMPVQKAIKMLAGQKGLSFRINQLDVEYMDEKIGGFSWQRYRCGN